MSWMISRTFQDIFELISRTFFYLKNVEGISNFKEMEQQSSFQIPINLSFLKFINFQDFPGHFTRFQDIPGHFFISKTFQDFQESGNPVRLRVPTQMSCIMSRTFQVIFELISRTFQDIFWVYFQEILPKNVEGISNFKEMEQQSSFQISINLSFLKIH